MNADSLLQTPRTLHAICQQDGVQHVVQRRDSRFHTDPSSSRSQHKDEALFTACDELIPLDAAVFVSSLEAD